VRYIRLLNAIPLIAAAACSSNYHPEYHPVTVSNFSQNLSYPVAVNNGGSAGERAPVYVMPAPQAGVTAPAFVAPPAALPPDFFH
jgi:hypothetical protein